MLTYEIVLNLILCKEKFGLMFQIKFHDTRHIMLSFTENSFWKALKDCPLAYTLLTCYFAKSITGRNYLLEMFVST